MNTTEIDRLAAAAHALRPDWPLPSLRTFITNDLNRHAYRDAAVALTWVATDPTTLTPKRVLEAGPWWVAETGNGTPTPPPVRTCRRCGAYVTEPWEDHETACSRRATAKTYAAGAAAARAALKTALAGAPDPTEEDT